MAAAAVGMKQGHGPRGADTLQGLERAGTGSPWGLQEECALPTP